MAVDLQPVFFGGLDTADWRARHEAGLVPDAYPYGLDRLERHGYAVRDWSGSRGGALDRARGAVRRLGGGIDWIGRGLPDTPDLVVSWDERLGVPLALRHAARVPVVTNVIWVTEGRLSAPVHRAVSAGLGRAARVFLHSEAQVPVLRDRFGVREERLAPIAFGVDADFFRPADDAAEVDRDLVVSVGNDRHRDFATVLRAFAQVRRARPSSRLVVVSRVVAPADVAGIEGVTLVPALDHAALGATVRSAAVGMTLTRPNGHVSGATAVLETLAVGRPAIATANPGMADYARQGGLTLVPPADADAAALACLAVLEDPSAADDVGAQGRAAVERTFSTERHAERLAGVLDAARGT
ncbi:glycosyltransferase family 4 protein [Actinotalea ferrariae]|uniref:glycosyltransferase n=1 Tax=Actinotalea ferrariae TaxID=1386098 RepID=UPI001C8CB6CB|nr:glycosyltransferase [Actinotalea ferrariae]MBX9244520.1 glycosyltransferase family 4 protein [Actinotalea ferrariae]